MLCLKLNISKFLIKKLFYLFRYEIYLNEQRQEGMEGEEESEAARLEVKITECKMKRNEAHKLWLDLESIFSLTSVRAGEQTDLNKIKQMVLTAGKMKRDADKMKETISSLDEEVEVLKKQRKI